MTPEPERWPEFDSFEDLIETLKQRLADDLPGPSRHLAMAPSHRGIIDPDTARERFHLEGAVLVLLYPSAGGASVVYTIRRADLRNHGGQVSFPGGRREEGESLEETAIREAGEEVGIDREAVELIAELTPLYIPPSRYIVHPFVGAARSRPDFTRGEDEVDRILEVPLRKLLDPESRSVERWNIRGQESDVPFFDVADVRIWGATAMITSELLAAVEPVGR